ncbi:MAG TPA: glycosyltransferase family 1 protein [Candidatus Saccharimonadales bacterium]|nr:glycosyltransferase family 1 protein [Candidatus Saccharimonadales bacterium]
MKKPSPVILFDANPLMVKRTGVSYYIAQLVSGLAATHPEATFVGYYYNFLGRKPRPTSPAAPNIHYRPIYHFPGPIINLLRRFRIEVPIELLTFMKPDFVWYANFLSQPSLFRTPRAATIHDLTFVDLPQYVARKNLSDLRRFIPSQLKQLDFVVIVSEFGKQRLHDVFHVPLKDILVTPVAPPPPVTGNKTTDRKILADMGITGKFFLTLSTVEPRKNVLNMLDAFLLLPEELQAKYTFVITGAIGWNCEAEVARLAELKRAGKNIMHLGYVTDEQRSALYRNATFYTSASRYEGFGMTPPEAMMYSLVCALSDVQVFREVAGKAALYFDQEDPESIARVYERLLTDTKLREQLAKVSLAQAKTYDWEAIARSLYDRMLAAIEKGHRS